ncbi:MAG: flagellar hook-length control protein FliK, partial [Fimbriimonadaceae bacterium]
PAKTAEISAKAVTPQEAVKAATKAGAPVEQTATQAVAKQLTERAKEAPVASSGPRAEAEVDVKPKEVRPVEATLQSKGGTTGDRATGETTEEGIAKADHGATEEPLRIIKHGDGQIATDTLNRTEKAAPTAPAAPVKTLNPAQSAAVTQQVREAADMMMASNRIGTVKIHLNPADLGEITIKVTQMGPRFDAQIDASREAVRNALVQNQGDLARAAESRGLTVGNLDIRSSETPNSTPSTSSAMQAGTDRHSFGNQGRQDAQQQPMREEYERWGRLADATREETAPGLAPAIYGHASQQVNMVI